MAATRTRYRVHRVDVSMTKDAATLEHFLDSLEGEVVSIVPNVTAGFLWVPRVDFLLVVEKIRRRRTLQRPTPGTHGSWCQGVGSEVVIVAIDVTHDHLASRGHHGPRGP